MFKYANPQTKWLSLIEDAVDIFVSSATEVEEPLMWTADGEVFLTILHLKFQFEVAQHMLLVLFH